MTLSLFESSEKEGAIFIKSAADRAAVLGAREWWFVNWRESIARLKALVSQKAEKISMKIVCAGFRNDVYDTARGTPNGASSLRASAALRSSLSFACVS